MAALKFRELRNLSDSEVEYLHDDHAPSTHPGLAWYRDELHRRQEDRRLRVMIWLTAVITILTAANVVLVAWTLYE